MSSNWEVTGTVDLLVECGMAVGHPWYERTHDTFTWFAGDVHGVSSVCELVGEGLNAKFVKALKAKYPEYPAVLLRKMRNFLLELKKATVEFKPKNTKRGRPSRFSDDMSIYWKTTENPHKPQCANWCMWEAAQGAQTRKEFMERAGVKSTLPGHDTPRKPTSKYFNELYKCGHIMFLVDHQRISENM